MQKSVQWRKHGLVIFNPYIGPLLGDTTPGQSGPRSDGNKEVLRIPQSSSFTGASPSDCLVSYLEHLIWLGSYHSAEKQPVYSTAQVTGLHMLEIV